MLGCLLFKRFKKIYKSCSFAKAAKISLTNLKQNLDASKNLSYLNHCLIKIKLFVRALQCKILSNILNKKLFQFRKAETPLCSFCKNSKKTPMDFFNNCEYVTNAWTKVKQFFKTLY